MHVDLSAGVIPPSGSTGEPPRAESPLQRWFFEQAGDVDKHRQVVKNRRSTGLHQEIPA